MDKAARQQTLSEPFTRRNFLSTSLKVGAAAFTTGLLPKRQTSAQGRYNVLFILVDDLRPLLGCYGHPGIHTPNIDALARRGTLFNRAYCQLPLCNPSRTSMLTGLRPETTKVVSNSVRFRDRLPNVVTLPQHFKIHGYHTQSIGKIAHTLTMQDDAYSWSVPSWRQPISLNLPSIPSWQAFDAEDDEFRDGKAAKCTVEVLEEIQNIQFFLAVGFRKPHLPFHVPKKYYELYKNENFSLPSTVSLPIDAPSIINNKSNWIREFKDIPDEGAFSDEKTLELIQGYAASISYMDAQVGRVLDQLDALRLTEKTIIVFVGDHGIHLGDHGMWKKNTLFESSLRSPLIVSIPGQMSLNVKTDAFAELVDIYPTLCDACQLPTPPGLEGVSLTPVIEQPTRPWKTAVFSQLGRIMHGGSSIRTERYRYTKWGRNANRGVELYDYEVDPDETVNVAGQPENTELVAWLSERLHTGWQMALPETHQRISAPQTLSGDINNDGSVDIQNLILISNNFGVEAPAHPKVDVNKDGKVNILDLLLAAARLGESSTSDLPSARAAIGMEHFDVVAHWLTEARLANDGSLAFQEGIAALERLMDTAIPTETVLLPNYPNPFNPETWIPYDLAEDSDVEVYIYNVKGERIRELSLGFQSAGTYRSQSRAAYWDGRNAVGESVASGIYVCTLHAGRIKVTRHMIILK